jgi:hypothetical protein
MKLRLSILKSEEPERGRGECHPLLISFEGDCWSSRTSLSDLHDIGGLSEFQIAKAIEELAKHGTVVLESDEISEGWVRRSFQGPKD